MYAQDLSYVEIARELTHLFGREFTVGMVTGQVGVQRLRRKNKCPEIPPGAKPVTDLDEIRGFRRGFKVKPGHAPGWWEII